MELTAVLTSPDLWSENYSITCSLSNDSSFGFVHLFSSLVILHLWMMGSWLSVTGNMRETGTAEVWLVLRWSSSVQTCVLIDMVFQEYQCPWTSPFIFSFYKLLHVKCGEILVLRITVSFSIFYLSLCCMERVGRRAEQQKECHYWNDQLFFISLYCK